MMGSDQGQRSNAVGSNPSYLPDADPGRHGGNTYTGAGIEPTIQDYENFFGPSARDIKTDPQRFKRHGRWHLPDILKGPNPWLTDRVDGLITDATNSPFTTKILPYRYKEDVDGKIKWNVWSFDEGMASRVPYESAARTLTQSKRSFAGYMVRQGMAITLEHNFMMTPQGRENFKNQLNQLIGSIQLTNDLDVHMALILAPSYQKTMRENYYSLEKSPGQICREFTDLFGMMQKNVNALDILIEEGKAILKTWGGPMPDFLLCNSKLTFQMTMTPEKTNYMTQGTDGVKRLKQGPDLTSYRGLSIVHSRAFAMETGQHPRDVLRRRVRTAEYYRILPNKRNLLREFEFYNEERDTFFTLTFQDLLRYALYDHTLGDGSSNANVVSVHHVLHAISGALVKEEAAKTGLVLDLKESLGALMQAGVLLAPETAFMVRCATVIRAFATPNISSYSITGTPVPGSGRRNLSWCLSYFAFDLGVRRIPPRNNRVWNAWVALVDTELPALPPGFDRASLIGSMSLQQKLFPLDQKNLYHSLQNVVLNDPFHLGQKAQPRTPNWFAAFTFYVSMYKRSGLIQGYLSDIVIAGPVGNSVYGAGASATLFGIPARAPALRKDDMDITFQMLRPEGAYGSVNHFMNIARSTGAVSSPGASALINPLLYTRSGQLVARSYLLTYEILGPMLREYKINGMSVTGIDYLIQMCTHIDPGIQQAFLDVFNAANTGNLLANTMMVGGGLKRILDVVFENITPADPDVSDAVYLARAGIDTWSMNLSTASHFLHPYRTSLEAPAWRMHLEQQRHLLDSSFGYLNLAFLEAMSTVPSIVHHWFNFSYSQGLPIPVAAGLVDQRCIVDFFSETRQRLYLDHYQDHVVGIPLHYTVPAGSRYIEFMPNSVPEKNSIRYMTAILAQRRADNTLIHRIADDGLDSVLIDMNTMFEDGHGEVVLPKEATVLKNDADRVQDVELVIVRPNIEHNMLGVIIGLGGDSLGYTLWGQTELSVYDDSMHGIWGMSYKYHERAIVFNEKNLIRLWDIAYDGYNGGKDDTYVDWMDSDAPNGYSKFQELTLDVSKNYRGPSMMVMAFVHDKNLTNEEGGRVFDRNFRRNWPSPIVFHDNYVKGAIDKKETLPLDYDNIQVIDVDEFRVFNNELYADAYGQYKNMMPSFHEMHLMRKGAGQSSVDSETHTDSLAFQGTMRIKEAGVVIQEIQGSGHHGPDYVGMASVRAGKGLKMSGQAPTAYRMV